MAGSAGDYAQNDDNTVKRHKLLSGNAEHGKKDTCEKKVKL